MKAAVYNSYGPPHVVALADLEIPVPKPDEILIRVRATTVNRTDTGIRSAVYVVSRLFSGIIRPKFPVLGNEFAGDVVSTGEKVKEFKEGDRVFGYNDTSFGGHAEYLSIRENDAVDHIPDNLSYREAAPLTEGAHYALCNIRAARVKAGQNVMVYGATGAIGSAAVQLLHYFGAHVTAVCHTKHVELVASLGADRVVDYVSEDFTATDRRFDFVFDAVGKISFGQCKRILNPEGIYVSTEPGKNGENIYLALIKKFSTGKRVIFPIPSISKHDVTFLGELAKKGIFKPVIDRSYRLDEIVEAHQYVETGQKTGNVVILP